MAVILIFLLLTGCSSVGDWLSGPAEYHLSGFAYPAQLEHITLGVTKQAEVRRVFGPPTDIQTSAQHGRVRETWAYAHANSSINPLQYLPLFGVLALTRLQESPTFSVSFASDGIVDGVSVREFQPYGDVASTEFRFKTGYDVTPYGMNNPMIHALQQNAKTPSKALPRR